MGIFFHHSGMMASTSRSDRAAHSSSAAEEKNSNCRAKYAQAPSSDFSVTSLYDSASSVSSSPSSYSSSSSSLLLLLDFWLSDRRAKSSVGYNHHVKRPKARTVAGRLVGCCLFWRFDCVKKLRSSRMVEAGGRREALRHDLRDIKGRGKFLGYLMMARDVLLLL